MLQQWATEIKEDWSTPNILAQTHLGNGEFGSRIAPMFSPLAARAEMLLRDFREKDAASCLLLIEHIMGASQQDIARTRNVSRGIIQQDLEACWASVEMAIYYRTKMKQWQKRPSRTIWPLGDFRAIVAAAVLTD
jgi:hypothetical protein